MNGVESPFGALMGKVMRPARVWAVTTARPVEWRSVSVLALGPATTGLRRNEPVTSRSTLAVQSLGLRLRYFVGLLGALVFAPVSSADDGCNFPHAADQAIVSAIVDGDTLRLRDGRKVRLLGINTPELETKQRPAEPLGPAAKRMLSSLLPRGAPVTLAFDVTRKDRYERTLAFAFDPDGRDVQGELLRLGLASALVVPPRKCAVSCYQRIEAQARQRGLGIWAQPRYQGIEATHLAKSAAGFHIVRGTVERVGNSRSAIWLNLADTFAVRIPRADLVYFGGANPQLEPAKLLGARVEARGWLYARKGQKRLTVRHPAALAVIAAP